ncbi:hypothetical protein QMO14_25360 [Variovorax sp. CAN2819]|nr:hypothetical protein [Variovorax sp. CAN15]MDN6886919.1 hypothetical protein [Variovorax sp. CAN15]
MGARKPPATAAGKLYDLRMRRMITPGQRHTADRNLPAVIP